MCLMLAASDRNARSENSGFTGIIENWQDIPSNPLLIVKKGTKEILIPYQQDFIKNIDYKRNSVLVSLPGGFLSIYD